MDIIQRERFNFLNYKKPRHWYHWKHSYTITKLYKLLRWFIK